MSAGSISSVHNENSDSLFSDYMIGSGVVGIPNASPRVLWHCLGLHTSTLINAGHSDVLHLFTMYTVEYSSELACLPRLYSLRFILILVLALRGVPRRGPDLNFGRLIDGVRLNPNPGPGLINDYPSFGPWIYSINTVESPSP